MTGGALDPMIEVLLTAWALSKVKTGIPPLKHAFPERLQATLRKARKAGFVVYDKDDGSVYLDEPGCAYLAEHGYESAI